MNIEIVEFSDEWAEAFASLNYAWIEKYFTVETHDVEVLDDPAEYVIGPGGVIFMAVAAGEPVGTVALIPDGRNNLELAKMAVSPRYQGLGVGGRLMERCIEYAVQQGVRTIWLESHTKLDTALRLYRRHGFVEIPVDPNSQYKRADIRMELAIRPVNM